MLLTRHYATTPLTRHDGKLHDTSYPSRCNNPTRWKITLLTRHDAATEEVVSGFMRLLKGIAVSLVSLPARGNEGGHRKGEGRHEGSEGTSRSRGEHVARDVVDLVCV